MRSYPTRFCEFCKHPYSSVGLKFCSRKCWFEGRKKGYAFLLSEISKMKIISGAPWESYPCIDWPFGRFSNGYGLVKNNGKMLHVHRETLTIFNGDPGEGVFACHYCDRKMCFQIGHLFAAPPAGNSADMVSKGRSSRGERHVRAVLTEDDVMQIRKLYVEGLTYEEIRKLFDVNHSTITSVVKRKTWRHI